ncbi:MAG: hypothetical protein HYZ29_37335 [Myxococcales bacterium]|nr:hypothetical protein [Myxococcales bacterium]
MKHSISARTLTGSAAVLVLALLACKKEAPAAGSSASAAAGALPAPSASASAAPKASFEELVAQSKPLALSPAAQSLGAKKVEATLCKLPGAGFLAPSASSVIRAIEVVGDQLLVADHEGVLHGFKVSTAGGCQLSVDASFGDGGKLKLPNKIENLSKADSGLVMAASGIFDTYALQAGKKLFDCKATGHFQLAASGKWGIVPWVNSTVEISELGKDSCQRKDWVLQDLSDAAKRKGPFTMVNTSAVINEKIYIGGIQAEKVDGREPRIVVIFDKAGKELGRFGNTGKGFGDDSFGWVHGITACGGNVCVVDSNFRRMSVWSPDGKKFVGAIKLTALFGVPGSVAWINDVTQAKDGAIWLPAGVDREGGKVAEGHVYRVTGM